MPEDIFSFQKSSSCSLHRQVNVLILQEHHIVLLKKYMKLQQDIDDRAIYEASFVPIGSKSSEMDQLIYEGTLSEEAADFLKKLVKAKYNIFISGGTSTGKTTMLNALMQYVASGDRVITIEDSAELSLHGIDNLVRLEMRQANVEGSGAISIRDLIHSSLRMRPDRLVIGEVRGAEAMDMLQAMNTGHDGCMSTGHANSASDMLNRLATMSLTAMDIPLAAIKGQIASALDIIIHLGRLSDKSRRVLEISEVSHFDGNNIILNPLFLYNQDTGLSSTGNRLIHSDKLTQHGISV